jgi:TetR/AcrR family transcriptional regulator, cholesterol catabolism regulator
MEAKERIILISIDLFTESGIRHVTMDQIAVEAGMSKRTIYELFRDKDELIRECLETMHRQNMEEVQEILSHASNAIEALYRFGQHGEKKKSGINRLFFEDIKKLYPQMWDNMKKRVRPHTGSFSQRILKQGIEEGIFLNDLNIEIVDAFFHIIMETFHKKEIFPENTSDNDLIRNIIIPYYIGISTEKGKNLIEQYYNLVIN